MKSNPYRDEEQPFSLTSSEADAARIKLKPILQALESQIEIIKNSTQKFSEIEQIFPLKDAAQRAANDYKKQVEVTISGEEVPLHKTLVKHLPRLLTHLLNNAISHGIELPENRRLAGKHPVGQVVLQASRQNNKAVVSFSDDGAGIDIERVKAKAINKGLITESQAGLLSDVQVYEFLFHPDFSTKDVRDMRAGTGYGLDIVRAELKKIGGNIEVQSIPGRGTTFTMIYSI